MKTPKEHYLALCERAWEENIHGYTPVFFLWFDYADESFKQMDDSLKKKRVYEGVLGTVGVNKTYVYPIQHDGSVGKDPIRFSTKIVFEERAEAEEYLRTSEHRLNFKL